MKKFATIALAFGLLAPVSAQNFNNAQSVSVQELRAAEQELSQLRQAIDAEKIPLSKKLEELENSVLRLRGEAAQMRSRVDGGDSAITVLQQRVQGLVDNNNYIGNLLTDYATRFETLAYQAELPQIRDEIQQARAAKDNANLSQAEKFDEQLDVIELAIKRLNNVIGGVRIPARALHGSLEVEGTFVAVGPVKYFSSPEASGISLQEVNNPLPTIGDLLNPRYSEEIRKLAETGAGNVQVDASGSNQAFVVVTENDTLVEEFKKGGMVMPFIIGLALIALIIAAIKWVQLARVKSARQRDLDIILEHLSNGRENEALGHARKVGGPVGDMLQTAVEYSNEDREVIEEVLYEKIIAAQPKLESWLPFVAVTAATAPLLGLLGTVTGMIKTFQLITIVGTGDARSLSSGISEALITTKWGLISAIPTLILHALLSRKAKGVVGSMEQTAVGFLNGIAEIRDSSQSRAS